MFQAFQAHVVDGSVIRVLFYLDRLATFFISEKIVLFLYDKTVPLSPLFYD